MSIFYTLLGFIIGFGLVTISIPPLIRVSIAKRLFDTPNERKASKIVVPTLGGVAIFIGFILSTIVATDGYNFSELKYLIAAVIVMFFLGLKDDLMDLSALKKFIIQIATALMLIILGDFRFTNLQGAFGVYEINYIVSCIITMVTIIGFINAFNLIDGIDGLASGISIVVSLVFGTWFLLAGHYQYGILCFSLTGSLAAFFLFNVFGKENKIFMGDTGSLILGVIMAILVIKFNELNINQDAPYAVLAAPAVSIGIMIIPVIDTLRVFFIRLSEKRSPFSADMNHLHHNFLKLGYSHLGATLFIISINIFFIGFAFSFSHVLNINSLTISLFILGLTFAYLPILVNKWRQSATFSSFEKSILKNSINKKEILSKHALPLNSGIPNQSTISKKEGVARKELADSPFS